MPSQPPVPSDLSLRLQAALEGRYTLEQEIDRGGAGVVYRAHDVRHGRNVAVKVLPPDVSSTTGVERFLQEIRIAARLNHPHILPLHDSGEADGLIYYVMPFMQGKSLKDRLTREKRLPIGDVIRIAGEVGSALDRAHREGVIHRDIKPANILFEGSYAVVADFGIARAIGAAESVIETRVGDWVGTAAYMSPEQAAGSPDIDGRSDLYSLGCTVYEMLAGHPPFPDGSLLQVVTRHIVEPVPSLSSAGRQVPPQMEQAVMKALEKDPADRFRTLMDFANALNRAAPGTAWQEGGRADEEDGLWGRIRSLFVRSDEATPEAAPKGLQQPTDEAVVTCPRCGVASPGFSRYCRQCGASLTPTEREEVRVAASPAPNGAVAEDARIAPPVEARTELRQLTVMFSDVVGLNALSAELDPESELEVVQEYLTACEEAVRRFDGQIVQYQHHGVVAYFGYPVAHEDAPVRAGLAGLQILHAMQSLNAHLESEYDVRPNVRMGIHTGPAVVGSVGAQGRRERLAIGETPTVAARLRESAPADGVLVSGATHRLFKGYFTCQEMGSQALEGIAEPLATYRLLAESGVGRRPRLVGAAELPPIVGREKELDLLHDAWIRATEGEAQMTLLGGEAGIGKSRLVVAAAARLAGQPHILLECGCSPFHTNTALHAVIDMLERWMEIESDDSPEARVGKLEETVRRFMGDDAEAVSLLAELMSLPLGERHPPIALEPALKRRRTLDALLGLLRGASEQRPVMLVIEDLHWIDPSTAEFLTMWLDHARAWPMMVLGDFRPEFVPPWDAPHVKTTFLKGLDEEQVAAVMRGVTRGKSLPAAVVEQIVQRADGVPLFIEETTRELVESGYLVEGPDGYELAGALPKTAVPFTLRDALTARIDRLGRAKAVVQLGAVIGREFRGDLLLEVSDVEDWVALNAHLSSAVDAGILDSIGSGPQTEYTFRHALVQDNAYHSLVRKTRRAHHKRIMEVLEASFPSTCEAKPELLAHHCTEAGAIQKAIPYWLRAGQMGIARAAFTEAVHHLTRGVKLIESLAEGAERDRLELALQTALGLALQASKGYAAPEVERAYSRARVLCRRGGDPDELMPVLLGQYLYYSVRADYGVAGEVAQQMLELASAGEGSSEHLLLAHLALGLTTLYLGDLVASRAHFEKGIELYEPTIEEEREHQVIGNPGPFLNSYLARALWILGEVDRALECSHRSLTLARTMKIPLSRAQALGMHTLLLLVRRDNAQARRYAAEAVEYATRHGFAYWQVLGSMCEAWLTAQAGNVDQGIERFRRFLDLYLRQGAKLGLSWFLGVLAEMYAQSGRMEEASDLLEQALQHIEQTGERYYEAEIYRLKGNLELLRDDPEGAEECFTRALDVARRQSAVSWQLRASVSLGRLWRDEGRTGEAHRLVVGAYAAATKGASGPSPDRDDAQRLIEELEAHM